MKRKIVGTEEFMGLETNVERSMRRGAQKDQNADRTVLGVWKVRGGLADTGITDGTSRIDSVGWGKCSTGNVVLWQDSAGSVFGQAAPTPTWTAG